MPDIYDAEFDTVRINIDISQVSMVAPLNDGVVTAAVARRLDHSQYMIDDPTKELNLDPAMGGTMVCALAASARCTTAATKLVKRHAVGLRHRCDRKWFGGHDLCQSSC